MTHLLAPKIYHLHPLVAGPLRSWGDHFKRISALGFNWVCLAPPFQGGPTGDIFLPADLEALHPALQWEGTADSGMHHAANSAADAGLRLMLDIRVDRVARTSAIREQHDHWFSNGLGDEPPDPRRPPHRLDAAYARLDRTEVADGLAELWFNRLERLLNLGLGGIRCLAPERTPASLWRRLLGDLNKPAPEPLFLAWTARTPRTSLPMLEGVGFDYVSPAFPSWDRRAAHFVEESQVLRRIGPLLGTPEPSFDDRLVANLPSDKDPATACRQAIRMAAAIGSGLFMPMGFEFCTRMAFDRARGTPEDFVRAQHEAPVDLSEEIRSACALADRLAGLGVDGAIRTLTAPGASATAFLRADTTDIRDAAMAVVVVVNPQSHPIDLPLLRVPVLPPQAGVAFGKPQALASDGDPLAPLDPGEIRVILYHRNRDVHQPSSPRAFDLAAMAAGRIAIEAVSPLVADGDFPVKATVGSPIVVSADLLADGHEQLSAALCWRAVDEPHWQQVAMHPVGNDRWEARFTPFRVGEHLFTIDAWWDTWSTFRHDLQLKRHAGQNVGLEIQEGRSLIQAAHGHAAEKDAFRLQRLLDQLTAADDAERVSLMLSPDTLALMHAVDRRPFLTSLPTPVQLQVDRPQAAFASWYELFPRSITSDHSRHGTFQDVIARLPAIREMGFDVLYFPPINPIGTTNRKGRNNSLSAGPDDVGSPYAIGGPDGGHDAIHAQLGTLEDFRQLVAAARENELEIALDFAIQCSPDHPWLKQHPDWFRWRPDGSIRYAENPPKKYEDIVNPDFFAPAATPSLWIALRDVVAFWVEQGVRTFRVDNPHTKPMPFWKWMIGDIRRTHPDVIFLAEAFTRPKIMYRLGKVGFSQSYTYFTWRNTKSELTEYMTELNSVPARDCYRPNFFVNTPDINPIYLQHSGRAGFLIRAALATTLSGLWGMYSGFETCEAEPLPGREEYLNSEKYEIRPRNMNAPGNIVEEITILNRIRRAYPALQTHLGLTFYHADNGEILLYGKQQAGDRDLVLVAVNLDPHNAQEATLEIPLWELGLPDHASVSVRDLVRDVAFTWYGKQQRVRLDPASQPYAIWHIAPAGTEA